MICFAGERERRNTLQLQLQYFVFVFVFVFIFCILRDELLYSWNCKVMKCQALQLSGGWSVGNISKCFIEMYINMLILKCNVLLECCVQSNWSGVEYWEHFKHVLWTEEINQGIGTQVRGGVKHWGRIDS